jgi:tryptophan synthase alpha subunit
MILENKTEFHEIDNEEFFKLNLEELNKSNKTEKLVGFVINSKFSLVNGLNAANAAIRTNYIIDSILNEKEKKSLKNTVLYRTPSSVKYNLAKINNFYN